MSSAEPSGAPIYEVWIEDRILPWSKDTITVSEIRDLAGIPKDCPVGAVDLVDGTESPLAEDAVHDVPSRDPGRPLVKRTQFKRIAV